MEPLQIALIQTALHWQQPEANRKMLQPQITALSGKAHVIVLPEMFTTGFSMQPANFAEVMDGETVQWLKALARQTDAAITGSIMIKENDLYYNRLLWVQPDGVVHHYDKKHLFTLSGEEQVYQAGSTKLVVTYRGWKICPMICYDLRFPVWSRNIKGDEAYDVLLYVANWPERRSYAWKQLLIARAIENQCYVAGVNRVGTDGNKLYHNGLTTLIDPMGEVLYQKENDEVVYIGTLDYGHLTNVRKQLPFLNDADGFTLND